LNKLKFKNHIITKCENQELKNLVIKNSKFFSADKLDVLESIRMAQWEDTEITSCHRNCGQVDHYSDLTLFNGFATYEHNFYPIYHSWIVNRHGKVIDPTYIIRDQKRDRLLRKYKYNNKYHFDQATEYFGFDENKILNRLHEVDEKWYSYLHNIQAKW